MRKRKISNYITKVANVKDLLFDVKKCGKILEIIFFFATILTWSNIIIGSPGMRYIAIWLMGGVLLLLFDFIVFTDKIKYVECNKLAYLGLLIVSVMIVSAMNCNKDNLLLPLAYLVIFPATWLAIISMENKAIFFLAMAKGVCLAYIVFLFLSLLFSPITIYNYTGILNNSNALSQFLTGVLPCVLYLISMERKKRYYIYASTIFTLLLFCRSRTGLLAGVLIFCCWIIGRGLKKGFYGWLKLTIKNVVFWGGL